MGLGQTKIALSSDSDLEHCLDTKTKSSITHLLYYTNSTGCNLMKNESEEGSQSDLYPIIF